MNTAITLPNNLFYMAEEYAEKHKLTRNELYATAVRELIKKDKKIEKKAITKKINKLCDSIDTSLNPQTRAASIRILESSEW